MTFRIGSILSVVTLTLLIHISISEASERKAESLSQLIEMFNPSRCKECHGEIYAQWEKSHHARSIMDIFMDRYLQKGVLSVKTPQDATRNNFPCFQCHFPQLAYATDKVASEIAAAILSNDKTTMGKLNISCLVCHHQKGAIHGYPEKGVLYGTDTVSDHEDEAYPTIQASPLMKQSVMCGQCHGLGPVFGLEYPVQCATLYGSYLHAYVPSGGTQTCQECHMKEADHTCPPNFKDRSDTSRRLAQALPMEVEAMFYRPQITPGKAVPTVVVETRITSRAGHRIPDG